MRVSYGLGDRLEQTRPGFEAKVRAKVRVRVRDRVRVTSGSCIISYLSSHPREFRNASRSAVTKSAKERAKDKGETYPTAKDGMNKPMAQLAPVKRETRSVLFPYVSTDEKHTCAHSDRQTKALQSRVRVEADAPYVHTIRPSTRK